MKTLTILLMAGGQNGDSALPQILMLVGIIVVFYFFMIRPQVKKQKEQKQYREGIKNGDKIVTVGGIYGKVVETSENTVIIEVEGKMRLKVDKNALQKDASSIMGQK